MTRRLPTPPTPSSHLGDRCPALQHPSTGRCLEPSVDGSELCVRHATRVHLLDHCTHIIEHDDGGLVPCGVVTVARRDPVRCTEHSPSWRSLGIDAGGPR